MGEEEGGGRGSLRKTRAGFKLHARLLPLLLPPPLHNMAYRAGLAQKAIFSQGLKGRAYIPGPNHRVTLKLFSHSFLVTVARPDGRALSRVGGRGEGVCQPRRDRRGSRFDARHRRVNTFYERVRTSGCEAVNGKETGGGRRGSSAPHLTSLHSSTDLSVCLCIFKMRACTRRQRTSAVGLRRPTAHAQLY